MQAAPRRFVRWRLLLWCVLLPCGALLLVHRWGDLAMLIRTLRQARPLFLSLALLLQCLTLINQAALYQSLYALLGLPARWRELAPLVWAGHFINAATPSAGLGGTSLLVADARRRGLDFSRVALANTLYFLLNFAWFALVLLLSLVALGFYHELKRYEIVTALVLFGGVAVALATLIMAVLYPIKLGNLLCAVTRLINGISLKVLSREMIKPQSVRDLPREFSDAAQALLKSRHRLLRPLFHTVWVDGLEILTLGACFIAFPGSAMLSPALVTAGYAIGTLFVIISVTPQGVGVVESVMIATFVSLGVPFERAAVVVLLYRGLSFWLPLLVGMAASRSVLARFENE